MQRALTKLSPLAKYVVSPTGLLVPTVIFVFFGSVFGVISVFKHVFFETYAWDLGIFVQTLYLIANGFPLFSTIMNEHFLGNHFSPTFFLLFPLSLINLEAIGLLVVQALWVSLGAYPLFLIAKHHLKHTLPATTMTVAYFLFLGLQHGVLREFHEITLAPTLFLFLYFFIIKERTRSFFITLALFLGVKENLALTVIALGIWMIMFNKKLRTWGLVTAGLGAGAFVVMLKAIIPYYAINEYIHTNFGELGKTPGELIVTAIQKPLLVVKTFFSPIDKVNTMKMYAVSVAFLAFFDSFIIVLAPSLAEKFLDATWSRWQIFFHYSIMIAPILWIATIRSIANIAALAPRVVPIFKKIAIPTLLAMCVLVLTMFTHLKYDSPLTSLVRMDFYAQLLPRIVVYETLRSVPGGDELSISAQDALVPHLAERKNIYLFPQYADVDVVVLHQLVPHWPLDDNQYEAEIEKLENDASFDLMYEDQHGGMIFVRSDEQ